MIAEAPTIIRRAALPEGVRDWTPKSQLGFAVLKAMPYLPEDLALEIRDRFASMVTAESSLRLSVVRNKGLAEQGLIDHREVRIEGCPHGPTCDADSCIVSRKSITDTGVAFLVDAFQNTTELENLKFHGIGTGGTAEAASQTALVTELTTEYNPNSTRATGTTTEAAANIYQTVATNTLDSGTPAITEHGVFSQAATGGGTMWDRSLFSAINLVGANADGLQSDYRATFTSGG